MNLRDKPLSDRQISLKLALLSGFAVDWIHVVSAIDRKSASDPAPAHWSTGAPFRLTPGRSLEQAAPMDTKAISQLLDDQFGVISRAQLLGLGAKPHDVARLLRRKDLATALPGVYLNHTGDPSWPQRAMAGVLACWPAALADESAVRAACGPGYRFVGLDVIHVVIERDRKLAAPPGVRVHRKVRFAEHVQSQVYPPRLKYEEAVLDLAVSQGSDLEALSVLATAVWLTAYHGSQADRRD